MIIFALKNKYSGYIRCGDTSIERDPSEFTYPWICHRGKRRIPLVFRLTDRRINTAMHTWSFDSEEHIINSSPSCTGFEHSFTPLRPSIPPAAPHPLHLFHVPESLCLQVHILFLLTPLSLLSESIFILPFDFFILSLFLNLKNLSNNTSLSPSLFYSFGTLLHSS